MTLFLLVLAALTLLLWAEFAVDVLIRAPRLIAYLEQIEPPAGEERARLPKVTIVFGARDEERGIERAVRSMLALDYPDLEVVAVDDRSTDRTARILTRLAAGDERLRLITVTELPAGWLGKNHALELGAQAARGEVLLFTDADVEFEPDALLRAVAQLERAGIDHLAVAAAVTTPGPLLKLFVTTFALFFCGYYRPWRSALPGRKEFAGFGAFNLVRAQAYRRAGTHAALRLDPLDDIQLGRLLKQSGARQQFGVAGPKIRVEWYPTYGAALRGIEKNTLAAVGWSVPFLVLGAVVQLLFTAWPYAAVFVTGGVTRWLNLASVALIASVLLWFARWGTIRPWTVALLPLGVLLVLAGYFNAVVRTVLRRGIVWRGTFYPLSELRRAASSGRAANKIETHPDEEA